MTIEWISLFTFVGLTTFTPGPNNVTSASFGILYGWRKSFRYLIGIAAGMALVFILTAGMTVAMSSVIFKAEKYLKIAGSLYILWLAWNSFKAEYDFNETDKYAPSFRKGFFLQLINPKVAVYSITLFTTFLFPLKDDFFHLLPFPFMFAFVGFLSVLCWTFFGMGIRKYLKNIYLKRLVNTVLALMLVYIAVSLSGVLDYIEVYESIGFHAEKWDKVFCNLYM